MTVQLINRIIIIIIIIIGNLYSPSKMVAKDMI